MSIFKKTDRFDLEQAILSMWNTKEDLDLFYGNIEDMDLDEQWNTLLGLIQLVDMRCKKAFDIFEDLVHQGVFDRKSDDSVLDESLFEQEYYDSSRTDCDYDTDALLDEIFSTADNGLNYHDDFLENLQKDFNDALDNEDRLVEIKKQTKTVNPWDNTASSINFGQQ